MYTTEDERTKHAENIKRINFVVQEWTEIRDLFRSDEDFVDADIFKLQDKVDAWMLIYFKLFPNSSGCYLHMLHKGHMRGYLLEHKNLHKWCNIDAEAHNGFLKNVLSHRCQGNGHKKSSSSDENQKEFLANSLMRLYMRRIVSCGYYFLMQLIN